MAKVGANIVIIGRQGSGKTPTIKKLLEKSKFKNKVVYDRRKEYDSNEHTIFYKLESFRNFLLTCVGCFIVIEEATGFLSAFKDLEISDMMIGIEHNNNICVFVFHSIEDVPKFIFRFSRFTILLETNDDKELVKRTRPKMYKYMEMKKPVYIDNNTI